jgi:hypothetical protein
MPSASMFESSVETNDVRRRSDTTELLEGLHFIGPRFLSILALVCFEGEDSCGSVGCMLSTNQQMEKT